MNLLSNSRLLASSLGQGPCGFPLRKYASGSVQAKKTRSSTSSKPIHERPALLSEGSSTKFAAKSRSSPKTFAAAAKTKVGTSSSRTVLPREATTHEAPAATHKTTGGLPRTQDAQGTGLSDEEMQLKQADQMMLASQFMPYTDIWGQNVPESLGAFTCLFFLPTFLNAHYKMLLFLILLHSQMGLSMPAIKT